ncbi:hypothetical protein K470DRAFT_145479 [Piedraia hortae CBS 480.64]|uniref:Uncharacterized protein n=1 Tax=Piedraia hortae CBS 480.64 TaxID=1314780 RepID=A0A6A7BS68_9PEZI|nr:hypothetical protein K470DRAFT_145479 [Piedraia hortae CBS 480.64]
MSAEEILTQIATSTDAAASNLTSRIAIFPGGISLLDLKNELFLAYLQFLALRNLVIIRGVKDNRQVKDMEEESITQNLAELRTWLERGIKPLEERIRTQVEKVLRCAEDADSAPKRVNPVEEESEGEDEEDEEAVARPLTTSFPTKEAPKVEEGKGKGKVYRPPRFQPMAMPEKKSKHALRTSRAVEEFIQADLADAPTAQPSIGSGLHDAGERRRAKERERKEYEEINLVRLPQEKKKKGRHGRDRMGDGLNVLEGLSGDYSMTSSKGREGALEKSKKRSRDVDAQEGAVGERFERKRKRLEKRSNRRR